MEREYTVEVESKFAAEMEEVTITPDAPFDDESEVDGRESVEIKVIGPEGTGENGERRKVIQAKIVHHHDGSDRRVNMTLTAQRRHRRGEPWKNVAEFNLTQLRGGEEARLYLNAAETWELFQTLKDLYAISREGEPSGERRVYHVLRDSDTPHNLQVQEVLSFLTQGGDAVWEQIAELKPNIPLALALHKVHAVRAEAVAEFEHHLSNGDWDEGEWQKFFTRNTWIFGHGLAYHVLDTVQEQAHYGGRTVSGRGEQRGDYLMATRATIKFTVLVEIKRPDTPLLKRNEYRNKVYGISDELAGGVAQVQSNCRTWIVDGSRQEENCDALKEADIFTYEPKGILVAGNTAELSDRNKGASFELFRRNLNNPEVLTFDEILARAKFVVESEKEKQAAMDEVKAGSTHE